MRNRVMWLIMLLWLTILTDVASLAILIKDHGSRAAILLPFALIQIILIVYLIAQDER